MSQGSKCVVDGCNDLSHCKGMCPMHYWRVKKYGDPNKTAIIRGDDKARFWSKVKVGAKEDCWEWIAKSQMRGYGYFQFGGRLGKHVLAHRYSYELANGEIPELESQYHGYAVMHLCDNRKCVNPAHLRLGTQAGNCRDAADKGRCVVPKRSGTEHHNAVNLTREQAAEIAKSTEPGPKLAKRYGISKHTVNRIKGGTHWLLKQS